MEVQLAGVPLPITRVGRDVSTAFASAGTVAWPFGLPTTTAAVGAGDEGAALGAADDGAALAPAATQLPCGSGTASDPHPAGSTAITAPATTATQERLRTAGA
ncbi:hypothetical protein GCM10009661_43320 [Catellatospora chokoriensis]|uniref:Uncharacterized protein n=1 Tax=Catellatospora chokoriensis TaxID=310353 RepID=A0A8J3JYB1_9ACTN|nr:hypothetical protein Cch02nite_06270 [Catellatospora chokoriensis]